LSVLWKEHQALNRVLDPSRLIKLPCLIIRLIIQTIRRVASQSVWIDDASNLSRPDSSGADQIDVAHQATDLAFDRLLGAGWTVADRR
jgi:hypothetical protein